MTSYMSCDVAITTTKIMTSLDASIKKRQPLINSYYTMDYNEWNIPTENGQNSI